MKKHSLKELVILILMFFLAMKGFGSTTINEPCLSVSKVKVVVIGAKSTLSKDGEHSWVEKYSKYLKTFNQDNEIVNLTNTGLNSYHIVPTGSSSPIGRPKSDPEFNISKAISLNPDAIIVNLEDTDLIENFQANEQIINIMLIAGEANKANIPVWVNTPKPMLQLDEIHSPRVIKVKNLIQQRFNPFVVNFWDELAQENGLIKKDFLSPDGKTINAAAENKMMEELVKADIHQYCARRKYKGGKDIAIYSLTAQNQENKTQKFDVTIANSGNQINEEIKITIELVNQVNNKVVSRTQTLKKGLESCQFKTLEFEVSDLPIGNYDVKAYVANRIDRNAKNDTTAMTFKQVAIATPTNRIGKKSQIDNSLELYAISIDGFSSNFNKLSQDGNYRFSNGGEAKVYRVQDIFNEKDINSTTFKIQADKAFEISAFEVEVEHPGKKLVEIFYKRNLDSDKDNSLDYWHLASTQEVDVENGDRPIEILTKDIRLKRNDNVGIYIRTKDISGLQVSQKE